MNRRDLMKTALAGATGFGLSKLVRALPAATQNQGHIILLVFDAWSAENVSLYGYPRRTMPNLEAFAQTATVYHRHHSAATFTNPGVSSLVSGLYPFTHRALNLKSNIIAAEANKTIFSAFAGHMRTVAFTQNIQADQILAQSAPVLDRHIPLNSFNLDAWYAFDRAPFDRDALAAFNALDVGILNEFADHSGSFLLGPLYDQLRARSRAKLELQQADEYPRGLPNTGEVYSLASIVQGLIDTLGSLREPSLVYFHVYTPHEPYAPLEKFNATFSSDGVHIPFLPNHPLVSEPNKEVTMTKDRRNYDAYLASWDDELAKFFAFYQASGLKEGSTLAITSDHGEMFDRGLVGHITTGLFQPLLHVPLLVSTPSQQQRVDITTPTSSVDVMPTLCQLAGLPVPQWAQGVALPGLGGIEDPKRVFYAFDGKDNSAFARLTRYSIAMFKGLYKLVYYHRPEYTAFEFYDLHADPAETHDLYPANLPVCQAMEASLRQKLADLDAEIEKPT